VRAGKRFWAIPCKASVRIRASDKRAYIRHPGYLAGTLVMLASGLALDSWLAAAFLAICTLPFLFYRAIAEDRMLLTQLPGYRDYAARVRGRLLPGLW
jgi:protein-S-isoprenylcysteine O-methyltransferase Ste14